AAHRSEQVQTHGGWERRDEHDGVGLVQVDQGQHFDTVLGHEHRVTAVFEDLYHARPSVVVLGDDQDSLLVWVGLGLGIGIGVGVDHGSSRTLQITSTPRLYEGRASEASVEPRHSAWDIPGALTGHGYVNRL